MIIHFKIVLLQSTAISKDEGKTWDYIKDINTEPDGWYCYIDNVFKLIKIKEEKV